MLLQGSVKFLAHDNETHADHVKVFTDDSKSINGVGCAVYLRDTSGKIISNGA